MTSTQSTTIADPVCSPRTRRPPPPLPPRPRRARPRQLPRSWYSAGSTPGGTVSTCARGSDRSSSERIFLKRSTQAPPDISKVCRLANLFAGRKERSLTYEPEEESFASSSMRTSTVPPRTAFPPNRPPSLVLALPITDTLSWFPSADLPSNLATARRASSASLNLRRTVTSSAFFAPCTYDSRMVPHALNIDCGD